MKLAKSRENKEKIMHMTTFNVAFHIMFQTFYVKRASDFVLAAYCSLYPG